MVLATVHYRQHQLQAAAVSCVPPMRDTVTVLKKKIMAFVRDQAQQEAAGEDAVIAG